MIITSCSVGLTAFAADGNKTDTNSDYWSNSTDASTAFESLNNLADAYIPQLLQIDAIKKLLEDNLGMTVTDSTTISDVVAGASPMLLGLLGSSANVAGIRGTTASIADIFYAYLDDDDAAMDFYTLYTFCEDNKNSSNKELAEYCTQTLEKLNTLLAAYQDANDKLADTVQNSEKADYYDSQLYQTYGDEIYEANLETLENAVVDGVALKNTKNEYATAMINYVQSYFDLIGADLKCENFGQAYYYMSGNGSTCFFGLIYLYDANLGGAKVTLSDDDTAITPKNYADVISKNYSVKDYCLSIGISNEEFEDIKANDPSQYNDLVNDFKDYKSDSLFISNALYDLVYPMGDYEIYDSPYYNEMCIGTLKYSGLFDDTEQYIKDCEITDEQLEAFAEYANANWVDQFGNVEYKSSYLTDYVNSSACAFSEPVAKFISSINNGSSKSLLTTFGWAAVRKDIDGMKSATFTYAREKWNLIELINYMIPNSLIETKISQYYDVTGLDGANDPTFSFIELADYYLFVAPSTASVAYDYDDYAIPDDLIVEATNAELDGIIGKYLTPGNKVAGLIDLSELLQTFMESDISLYSEDGTGALNDLWLNLYNSPVETIFKLLPTITIVLDEVVVPLLFHGDGDYSLLDLGSILLGQDASDTSALLYKYSQNAGSDVGIGDLKFDLNTVLPSVLHWLIGDESTAYDIAGHYSGDVYDNNIPKFTNIYVADKAIYGARIGTNSIEVSGLARTIYRALTKNVTDSDELSTYKALSIGIDEAVTEIATFAMESIDEYLTDHADDTRYIKARVQEDASISQKGLNNILVALPQVLNIMGQKYIEKYNVDSDWTYTYDGKITTIEKSFRDGTVTQLQNTTLQAFKDTAVSGDPNKVLDQFVNIFIGNWINGVLDIVNDTLSDENNDLTSKLPLVQGLLAALGGFGETSVITDVVNGLFQLKRSDDASFTLTERSETGFVGFSNESGFFLLSNIQFSKDGQERGLIPVITTLISNDGEGNDYKFSNAIKSNAPTLASSKKSAAGTDYSKLLTKENTAAAQTLIDTLDELLSSLLSNTSLNGFDWDSTDNILSSVVTFISAYLGTENTNDIVKLLNNYLYFIVGESSASPSKDGKIGTAATSSGNVNKKKVYTSANLSNLVIQTYSLVENIVDYLFYNSDSGLLTNRDPNMLIADALYGIISPDAVAVRLSSDYSKTAEILQKSDNLNWNSFKVQITAANTTKSNWSKDYLKFGFKNGDKTAFYDALGESLNGIAAIVGTILTSTYTDSSRTSNWYSEVVYPELNSLAKATGASGVMSPSAFNKATNSQKLVKGILTPVSNILDTLYDAPVTFILNVIKGEASVLQDSTIKKIVNGVIDPINNLINGATDIVGYLSPTLSSLVKDLVGDGISVTLPKKNIAVSLINSLIGSIITLPNINWSKLASAKSPAEVLLLVYGYVVDTLLNSDLIKSLLDSLAPGITDILENLSATKILEILNEVLAVVQSPTEVYWTFSQYAAKLMNKFAYPTGVTASEASEAVTQLDELVANVFPLLNGLGVTDIEGLSSLVNDNLYTNEILTKLATTLYGALNKNSTVVEVLNIVGIDVSTKGVAAYLMDSSYGKTYSSAASKLKKAKNWSSVKSLNWGFTNGSSKAETGFINGLAAVLRPLNNILSVFLAEGKLSLGGLDLDEVLNLINVSGSTTLGSGETGCTLKYSVKNGLVKITVRSNVKTTDDTGKKANTKASVLKIDLKSVLKDFEKSTLNGSVLDFGTNGYESAIIPILEAFMCDNVKTYKQYKSDYKKAKDNILIDVLKPIVGLVDDVCDAPFDTVTKILPNVAYFIDSYGVSQAVNNLLAPVTADDGLIGVLDGLGIDVDEIVESLVGTDLGSLVADKLGLKVDFNLEIANLDECNIQDIVVPLVNSILKSKKLGIKLPDFDFATIASHGTVKTVKSAAKNDKGKYTTKQVDANQGEVLVAVLRYVSDLLIKNASGLKKLICNISSIKKNATIANIIKSVFNQIGTASKDDIVLAVFYLLTEDATDRFFDYTGFKYDDSYEFSFGNMDEDFCRELAPMLDGLVSGLLEEKGGLNGLISGLIYKDDIISSIATGLYGAVEGVTISKDIGSLTNLLAMTDIDFSTSNVASLLTNEDYGNTYTQAASVIKSAGSWSKVNKDSLEWGVTDRDSFMNALCAVLRPIYPVLDVILNDASLNLFDLVKIPGSDGYSSTIVPLLEAFGVYNIKTQYQYREDIFEKYDSILLDIINPLWDKVEDILNAPVEMLADILPNLSLFFANDGLLQIVENLLTPVSELLEALKPIVNVNDVLLAAGLDIPKLLKDKVGLSISKFDIYDLSGTLAPLVGADNVVDTLNSVLGIIKISGSSLGIELPDIDWFKLASHGDFILDGTSQAATFGSRIYVQSDQDETLIAVLRFLIDTINYKGNYDSIVSLIGGLIGGSDSLSDTISTVLDMLKGDSDTVIENLVDMLQSFA
jgi:hypothetical protein